MIKRIEKEELSGVQFAPANATKSAEVRSTRSYLLERAQQLGNMVKQKVFIQFQTTDGPMEVHTTIWDVNVDFVGLKRGASIPLNSILDVRF
jgi:hypothetical protein